MAKTFRVPEIGDVVAEKYRIEEQIGKGGFGVVFRATQIGMERPIALKTLLPQAMAHEDMVERFRREAILARNLNHPNTIRLYDFGHTEGGLLYIAMEFLDGKPLDAILKQSGPLSAARVKTLAIQVLKSLAEAHQNNIVHRDLKPANVFVIQLVGEEDFVKVLDFGIAKAFDAEGDNEDARLTKTGIGFGTPFYMAPEQVRGRNICPATDLYALGLLMAECLTGETVFKGTSSMEIAVMQLNEAPPPIPEWVLRGALGPIIQRATQKDLRLRYPSAIEMLRDLRAVDLNATMDISTSLNTRDIVQQADAGRSKLPLPLVLGLVGVGLVILLLAGALVAVLMLGGAEPGPPALAKATPPATAEAPAPLEPDEPDEPDEAQPREETPAKPEGRDPEAPPGEAAAVEVEVVTQPEGAQLFDGEELLGLAPLKVTLAPGQEERVVTARLGGFKDAALTLTPAQPTLRVELEIEESAPERAATSRRARPSTASSALADAKGKDKKGGDKPAGKDEKKPDNAGGGASTISIPKL